MIHPEQIGERPPQYVKDELEKILDEEYMVGLSLCGVKLIQFVDAGDTMTHRVRAGETEYYIKTPAKEAMVVANAADVAELRRSLPRDNEPDMTDYYKRLRAEIDHPDYQKWCETGVSEAEIILAAKEYLHERPDIGSEMLPCRNCKGVGEFELQCSCTHGGVVFSDLSGGGMESERLREEGEADPDCTACEGTGKKTNDCPMCHGAAQVVKYPEVIFRNSETGESTSLRLDITQLVAEGVCDVTESMYTYNYGTFRGARRQKQISLERFIEKNLASIGIYMNCAVRLTEYGVYGFSAQNFSQTMFAEEWREEDGAARIRDELSMPRNRRATPQTSSDMSLMQRFEHMQSNISSGQNQTDATPSVIELANRNDFSTTMRALLEKADAYGCSVGVKLSFIATGEVGPALYLLDEKSNVVAQLSSDYTLEDSLENALRSFDRFIDDQK